MTIIRAMLSGIKEVNKIQANLQMTGQAVTTK